MILGGLQKLTLLDFPEHVACTVFTLGCNFRCPFCHNAPLVQGENTPQYDVEEFFAYLEKRKGILDGVAVTGGEPLLQKDIEEFLGRIKEMGYAVKLDTNGAFPDKLQSILQKGLADFVAMDIKNAPDRYEETAGCTGILEKVQKSAKLLMEGDTPFEFRTTAVQQLHTAENFRDIGRWIAGTSRYYIQQFQDSGNILEQGYTAPTKEEMETYLQAVREFVPKAELRGIS